MDKDQDTIITNDTTNNTLDETAVDEHEPTDANDEIGDDTTNNTPDESPVDEHEPTDTNVETGDGTTNNTPDETPVDEHEPTGTDEVGNLKSQNKVLLGVAGVLGLAILAMVGWLLWTNARNEDDANGPIRGQLYEYDSAEPELNAPETNPNTDQEATDEPEDRPIPEGPVDFVVARINGVDINASNVYFEIARAFEMLMWDYVAIFNDWEFDLTRDAGDGRTFGRMVLEQAARYAADMKLFMELAHELGVTVDEEQELMVASHVQALIQDHGRADLYEMLRIEKINDSEHLIELITETFLINNLFYQLTNDDAEFARFEHYMPIEVDATAKANEILERIQAGEDFEELMHAYSEDPGLMSYPSGYTFIQGDMVPDFEETTLALEIGEISGLVPTTHGYHIIMRIEPDPDNVFGHSAFHEGDGTEDLIGAQHILIVIPEPRPLEDMKIEAILRAFDTIFYDSDFEILPALDDITIDM